MRRFGSPAVAMTAFSAVAGTSMFMALQQSPSRALQLTVGILAIAAAILVSLQTFLDLGARAERHRTAGVRYKAVIRKIEQLGIGTIKSGLNDPVFTAIRQRLDALEEDMPVVPPRIYEQVEARYREPAFVDSVVQRAYPISQSL
jgi:hypothetical protein